MTVREVALEVACREGRRSIMGWVFPEDVPGLAVHRCVDLEHAWQVTHVRSGRRFDIELPGVEDATTFALSVAGLADWTQPLEALQQVRYLETKVRAHVRWWMTRIAARNETGGGYVRS